MRLPLLLTALIAVGCARSKEPAPAELEDIAAFMFLHWEDERTLEGAMQNLAPLLEANVDEEVAADGWRLTPLGPDAIAGVDGPDDPVLENLLGAAVAARSPFPIRDHARSVVVPDQVFSNPTNFVVYERDVVEGDPQLFSDGTDPLVRTVNDVETRNFGVSVPYTLLKDFRWVRARGIEEAIIGRAWIREPGCSPNGNNCLMQSWSIDLFYAQPDGGTIRFTSTWSEIDSNFNSAIGEDIRVRALASGMHQVFISTDEWLAGEGDE